MPQDPHLREWPLRLSVMMEAAYGQLRLAEEPKRQAVLMLQDAKARRRVWPTSHPHADDAGTAG